MTWKELYGHFVKELQGIYLVGEAEAIIKILFCWAGSEDYSMVVQKNAREVEDDIIILLQGALIRLLRHMPIQYITGESWFYKLKFFVSDSVLIPRPETEELVQNVLNYLKSRPGLRVLDIGTGSGCIAVTIKKNSKESDVTAIDISENALEVARKNALDNNAKINFRRIDFLTETFTHKFDVVVSNPPYIPATELLEMDKNVVSFEPHAALFVPESEPLLFYKRIALFASENLEVNGILFVETHEKYAAEVAVVFETSGFKTGILEDMFGKQRFVWATHCL